MSTSIKLKNDIFLNGEICDMGSNEYGQWVRWANGLQIVYKTMSGTTDITTAWGALYTSADLAIGWFPKNFISRPTILISPQTQSGTQYMITGNGTGNSGDFSRFGNIALIRPNSRKGVAYIIDAIAIGRWK